MRGAQGKGMRFAGDRLKRLGTGGVSRAAYKCVITRSIVPNFEALGRRRVG